MTQAINYPFPIERFPSPCFVLDDVKLRQNVAILDSVQKRTGAKILLALKCFSMWDVFPLISRSFGQGGALYGCCASSPHEARLAHEHFRGEVHVFAAAFSQKDMDEIVAVADHIVFNSIAQAQRFIPMVRAFAKRAGRSIDVGLRLNPEHSEGAIDIYNPCSQGSRLGVRLRDFDADFAKQFNGFHMHTLCQQGADALIRTVESLEAQFGQFFLESSQTLQGSGQSSSQNSSQEASQSSSQNVDKNAGQSFDQGSAHMRPISWLNLGGGHHITHPDYDVDALCALLIRLRDTYGIQVYLEPGEAVALNAGWLVASVLDIVQADMPVAILDTSAVAHMPDVLEMPYRPEVIGAGLPQSKKHTYRFAGKSCLAGDVIGEYSFDEPLAVGDRVVFTDMAIYSMVKTTTFNGLCLPDIARWDSATENIRLVRSFGYEDFEGRLS